MDLRERSTSTDRHPWELARLHHILELLRGSESVTQDTKLLDAGSGDSFVAASIGRAFPKLQITCWDANYSDVDLAETPPGCRRTAVPPRGPFDIVLALDVIEHVEDDRQFLTQLRSLAEPDALLVVTVPAYQQLFGAHDVYLGHHRRYSRRQLWATVANTGWLPLTSGGFFTSLLAPRALAILRERRHAQTGIQHLGTWGRGRAVTQVVERLLNVDAAAGRRLAARRRHGLPGLSIFLLAKAEKAPQAS